MTWSHRSFIMEPPTLGVVGHSWGALHGGRYALTAQATAFVSLGGGWTEWSPVSDWPLHTLRIPKLLAWGTEEPMAMLPVGTWNALPAPKHRLVFPDGEHWDYLPASETECDTNSGPCTLVHDLSADFAAVFLSKYMPPERAGFAAGFIPDNLVPPTVPLTTDQQFFIGGHLASFRAVASHPGCGAQLAWTTASGSGTRALP